mmetsp:Transcript_3877/g.3807  ORF Transcript_3877/g.3807 Transcript_3877/m.3807 type:complete len:81 (-) Transcript_3877:678-920(-)
MYRDYFETDLEEFPEDNNVDELQDRQDIANEGEFQFRKYDFVETQFHWEPMESGDDLVEQKIFKYKYRQFNDDQDTYERR